jgi:CheY-like chemotaxis protein
MNQMEIIPLLQLLASRPPGDADTRTDDARDRSTEKRRRILVVDDEPLIANTIAEILNGSGFEATAIYNARNALDEVRKSCPDTVISDVIMPHMNGIDMAITIKSACPRTRILLLSGQAGTPDLMEAARKKGHNFELLSKPLKPDLLLKKLSQ